MSDIGKAFENRSGTNSVGFHSRKQLKEKTSKGKTSYSFHRGQVQAKRLTDTQRKWIELMFPKNQKQQELICCLNGVSGKVDCTSVRYEDFAPLDEYFSGREGGELSPNEGMIPVVGDWGALKGFKGDGFYRFSWRFTNQNPLNVCEICVDTSVPLKFVTARELVLSIRQSVERASPRDLDQLNRDDETIQNELTNSDDKVFLYELLQNANDYPCPGRKVRVEIRLDKDCLCFRHTGREFSALNVNALCSAGAGDKSDNPNAIGYKGIGFKTVFRNNSRVYLKSGEYSFWFDKDRAKREVKINAPWRRVPIWDDVNYSDMGEFRVGFKLYPDRPELLDGANENGYRCILRRLFKDERVLLFIPELSDVLIQTSDNEKWCVSKDSGSWCVSNLPPIELPDSVKDEIDREVKARNIPPKLKGKEKTHVTFACGLKDRRLLPVDNACLYCFLPAERARWGFSFLMNTDMIPTGARDDVHPSLKLNQQFSRIAGEEFCKWIKSLLECGKYDYDSVFELIPDFDGCINKTEMPAVKKYLQEFKQGFESYLPRMVLPTNDGSYVPASECVFDTTGLLKEFKATLWNRLKVPGNIVNQSLWTSKAFEEFIKRYGKEIGINVFAFDDLKAAISKSEEFADWARNPMANSRLIRFLLNAKQLEILRDCPIFLDNHRELGQPCDMFFYGEDIRNVEKHLAHFKHFARYLSPDVDYHDEVGGIGFKQFGARTFLVGSILSEDALLKTREALKNIETAKGFWSFIAHYRKWDTKERFVKDYGLLGSLPVITESGDLLEKIDSQEYSVYIDDESSEPKIRNYAWFRSRARFINPGYIKCDAGEDIRKFLTDTLFEDKKSLIGTIEVRDVLVRVFDKFKYNILADIKSGKSAKGVYDFLYDCVEKGCINIKWLKEQIAHWPLENADGVLVDRVDKSVWYYDERLVELQNKGWFQGEKFVVLSQKCTAQKSLFDILGVRDLRNFSGFGEFFRTEIYPHLNTGCSDDELVEFHEYMRQQVDNGVLVSKAQFDVLKKVSLIVHTKEGIRRSQGCDGVLLSFNPINVAQEISEGRLPESVKVLDSRLCRTAEMKEYWQKLGCDVLDEDAVVEQTIAAYRECQRREENIAPVNDEFKTRHNSFFKSMIGADVDIALLKGVKLLDANGRLVAPENLVLPEVYEPRCHFQKYGCCLNYVSECYSEDSDRAKVAEYLRKLGVRDEFQSQDVGCLSVESFCKYYWTEYTISYAPNAEVIKAMKSVPSVLDRSGCVRKPSELYSNRLEYPYLAKTGDANKLLPLCEGINTEFYKNLDFRDSLTAGDAISFLLADSDGTDYRFRGRALSWIANGNLSTEDKERYRNDERATWKNLKNEQMVHVGKLCVIKSRGAGRVRAHFGNSEFVMDLSNICNGELQIGKEVIERAFEKLGVALVDNSTLAPVPSGEAEDSCIRKDIKVRLLILLAASGEEAWADAYAKKVSMLDGCSFKVCESIVESCVVFDQLKSDHGKFSEKEAVVYYVGGWQDKHVFLDVVKYLKKKLGLADQYTDEDLKEAFDTDGGDRVLVNKILSNGEQLLRNDMFMQTLKRVSPEVWQAVNDRAVALDRDQAQQKVLQDEGPSNGVEPTVSQEKRSEKSSLVDENSLTTTSSPTAEIALSDDRMSGLSREEQRQVLDEAKKQVEQKLKQAGYEFTQGLGEYGIVNGVMKDGVEYPLVVHSYKDTSRTFQLTAEDWNQLMKPNSMLVVRGANGIFCEPFQDLVRNREKIVLSFSTMGNLDTKERLGELAHVLRWFKGLHFDFGTLIPVKTGTVQLFDLPEQVVDEEEKQRHMSTDNEEVVF